MALEKPKPEQMTTRVNGLDHYPAYEKAARLLTPSKFLTLVPDPTNQYDCHAVKVCAGAGQIGWIPRVISRKVAERLNGHPATCIVVTHDFGASLGGLYSDRLIVRLPFADPSEESPFDDLEDPDGDPFDDEVSDIIVPNPDQLTAEFKLEVKGYKTPVAFQVKSDYQRSSADLYTTGGAKIGWFRKNTVSDIVVSLIDRGLAYAVLTCKHTLTFELRDARVTGWQPSPFWSVPPAASLMAAEIAHSRLAVKTAITQNTNQTKEPIMSKFDSLIASNKNAATIAATMEAGRIANNQVAKLAAKKLPMIIRGYADTPMGKLVIANLAQQAALHFRPGEQTLAKLTEAMQVQAFQELMQTVDLEGFIDNLMDSPDIKRAIRKLEPEAYASEEVGAPKTTRARK